MPLMNASFDAKHTFMPLMDASFDATDTPLPLMVTSFDAKHTFMPLMDASFDAKHTPMQMMNASFDAKHTNGPQTPVDPSREPWAFSCDGLGLVRVPAWACTFSGTKALQAARRVAA